MSSVLAYAVERQPVFDNEVRFINRREKEPYRSNSQAKKAQKKEESGGDNSLEVNLSGINPVENNQKGDNPKEKERKLLAAYQRGDKESGKKILNEIIETIRLES